MLEVPSLPHLIMVLVIFALLFGAKRVPEIAGSLGKGIKEFRQNIRDDDSGPLSEATSNNSFRRPPGTAEQATRDVTDREPKRLIR